MTTQDFTLKYNNIDDERPTIKSHEHYGLVTPDGVIHWNNYTMGSVKLPIEHMANNSKLSPYNQQFIQTVEERCKRLGISTEDYLDSIKFIKRTVVLSVLESEDVKHPWKAPVQDQPF